MSIAYYWKRQMQPLYQNGFMLSGDDCHETDMSCLDREDRFDVKLMHWKVGNCYSILEWQVSGCFCIDSLFIFVTQYKNI